MSQRFNLKNLLKAMAVIGGTGALLSVPAGGAFATNHSNNHSRSNNGDQGQAREFSRQRGDKEFNDAWWNDWRFGEGRENWEDRPQTCEQRQSIANRETDRLKRSAFTQHKKIGWQVDFQKWYADRHELEPSNWQELLDEADASKAQASSAINALAHPEIDCEQPKENDKTVLQQNKEPVLSALRDYHIDALNITYAVQIAK